mgnify:CR=1 FL=1
MHVCPALDDRRQSRAQIAKSSRKRKRKQKKADPAARRAALLAEQDAAFEGAYTAEDLRGLKLQHGAEAFREGTEVVLTLKDRGVLDSDGEDELVNVNMAEADAREERMLAATGGVSKTKNPFAEDDGAFGRSVGVLVSPPSARKV